MMVLINDKHCTRIVLRCARTSSQCISMELFKRALYQRSSASYVWTDR